MLAADVRFEGFTTADWTRLLSLFRPTRPTGAERDPARPRGGIVAVHDGARLRKLLHTAVGRLRLEDAVRDWPLSAEQLALRHHASWCVKITLGTLDAIMDELAGRCRRDDDLTAQLLALVQIATQRFDDGALELWPRRLLGVPIPSPALVRRTLDSVCPAGRTLVVGAFEGGELATSVALRRGPSGFDLILGPDEVRADMGLLAGDWRRDFRHLARAVEQRASVLALGCYAEVRTLRALEVDPQPGAWARAVAVRDVILSPVPVPLAIPLGIDAARAALSVLRMVAERFDPVGVVAPSLDGLRTTAQRIASELRHSDRSDGSFDPLEVLRRLLTRDR